MTFKHKLSVRLALMRDIFLAATVALAACNIPSRTSLDAVASKVIVSPTSLVVSSNQTTDLVAVALTAAGDTATSGITWTASAGSVTDTTIGTGLHRGHYHAPASAGQYKVKARATSGSAADSATVTVTAVSVASVTVSPPTAVIGIGAGQQFTAVASDSAGNPLTGRVITWSSNNPGVATVNISGLVSGVSAGSATISATSEGQTAMATVTVTPVPVAAVTISPSSATIIVGSTAQLTALTKDSAGNTLIGRVVSWASSNTTVATVNGSGLVTAVAVGSATVTATSEGQSGTAAITVTDVPVAAVTVSPASGSVVVGATQQFSAVTKDATGATLTGRVVTWASSNTAVATVSGSGLVTGRAPGSATITATSEGKSGSAVIAVTLVPVASVAVTPASSNLQVGATVQLTATPKDSAGNALSGRVVTWVTSNAGVATVSVSGLVRAVAVGLATITATSEGKSGSAAVTVTNVPVAAVTVSPASGSILVGATVQLTATPRDGSGNALTGRVVTWTSSNASVATVTGSGLVVGIAAGSATITATSEGISGTAAITVIVPPPGALPVFPGAVGYGTTTRGGRGGQVIRVTNLNDAGPGSLREALMTTGPRTVVFEVSGYIRLNSDIEMGDPFLNPNPWDFVTVAGQTAPSPGITIIGAILVRANDVLIQHLRFRPGIVGTSARRDALMIEGPVSRVMIDHVSVSWAGNLGKNMSIWGGPISDVTISNSINAEGFPYGLLIGDNSHNIAVLYSLFAHNYDRNPEVAANTSVLWANTMLYDPGNLTGGTVPRAFMGIWRGASIGAPSPGAPEQVNLIGNVARKNTAPTGGLTRFTLAGTDNSGLPAPPGSRAYVSDNDLLDGVEFGQASWTQVFTPTFALPSPLTVLVSSAVESYVEANAGARPLDRDDVDVRIINETRTRTGISAPSNENIVGGFPPLAQNTRVLTIPSNYATIRPSGYSVLEEDILFPLAVAVAGRP